MSAMKQAGRWVRSRDRRVAFAALLATLSRGVQRDPFALRQVFEQAVKHLLPFRRVELRDGRFRTLPPAGDDCLTLDVATSGTGRVGSLRAALDPARRLNDWDHQTLASLAHLGALVVEIDHLARTRSTGTGALSRVDGAAPLIGSSQGMRTLRERIERVAATDFCVLIEGESGTGKELVARHVHDLSRRSSGPFVAINCAALVETLLEAELFGIEDRTATGVRGRRGKFEHADGGTLFLDEVSDLSMSAQAKLLRAIQDLSVERVGGCGVHRVDTRIVVATNRSLADLVERGLFRPDLFYRLCGIEIRVPPLRTRREDIVELAMYFLARHRAVRKLDLTPGAIEALKLYDWPGNVRELERFVEGAVALAHADRLDLDDLPPAIRGEYAEVLVPSLLGDESMRAWGSRYARLMLERCAQNKRLACQRLDISYHTLQSYLRYRPAGAGAPGVEAPPWREEAPPDLALCRVPPAGDGGPAKVALAQAVVGLQD